jgi:type VI secretion system VgrG family protein
VAPLDTKEDQRGERLGPVDLEVWFPRGPDGGWHGASLRGVEAISAPFQFEVELVNDDAMVDHEELLGADCEMVLDRNGSAHVIHGVVAEVEVLTGAETRARAEHAGSIARIRVVPAFALLDQVVDTRFFAGQTVPEILRDVLTPALADYERQIDCESFLRGQYNRRDYCVQFRESTFAFCSRIMEEEGIAYLFVPDDEFRREKMILVDNNEDFGMAELLVPGEIPVVLSRAEELDRESIHAFDWRRTQVTNRVVTRGYNMKAPKAIDEGRAELLDDRRPVVREADVEDDRRQIIDDPVGDADAQSFTGAELAQRGPLATRLLQRHSLESAVGRGRSNAVGFGAGLVFLLGDHVDAALAHQKFVLVRVSHETAEGDGESPGVGYSNRFECIPFERPFRPALRTPRPHVDGVQTGVVVGRTQDEVYTDQFGRVRVKFHRDRHSADDEYASCWIRVAQAWAGAGYGSIVLPRVGMEVIVSFVDGNPDCPIVTGCVYNGANMPPYALPGELSKSTFKTASTPGGDGFNELRIEDAHGSEQIFVHAQRRMDLRVRGSLYETTGGSREERVGGEHDGERHGDHNTLVHKDVNHHVLETRYTKVDKEQYTSIGEDVVEDYQARHMVFAGELSQLSAPQVVFEASDSISHKSDQIALAGSTTITVKGGGKVVVESNNAIDLKVGASFISIKPDGIDIQGLMVRLNSGGGVGSATEGTPALAMELLEPLDALAADDGRPASGAGGGGGGGRTRNSRTLEPHHAPKMKPPPPAKPGKPIVLPEGTVRQFLSIAWDDEEVWCSEPVSLSGAARGYDAESSELVTIKDAVDGSVVHAEGFRPGASDHYEHSLRFIDMLPRRSATGYEVERLLHAEVLGLTTPAPIRMRFIPSLPSTFYTFDRGARFNISVRDYQIVVGGTIEYTRGYLFNIICLDGLVPREAPGKIGVEIGGTTNWRYSKMEAGVHLYWNGLAWTPVPNSWVADLTNAHGIGMWKERGVLKPQFGTLEWPDPAPGWEPKDDQALASRLPRVKAAIEDIWSGKYDIVRTECRSYEPRCCRYTVRCEVHFKETSVVDGGIIIAANKFSGRPNVDAWNIWSEPDFHAHEFGHLLGNPDEYEGGGDIDRTVNTDGATAGIDPNSIMGPSSGQRLVRRRHYNPICYALAELVREHTGKVYEYAAIPTRGSQEP